MKVLLTGADGLLGSNLTRELLKRGHTVRAFVQPKRQQKTLEGLDIEKFSGDLLDTAEIAEAAKGCDAVIHAAANTAVWPFRSEIIRKVNIEGTRNVMKAVQKNNCGRMIYVGTANSFGFGSKTKPGVEGNTYRSAKYGLDYMDSKYEAQQLVLREVKENKLPALIVNPTFMFGPYDSAPSSGAMIVAMYKGKIPGYAAGGKNYLCAKDAAVAIANGLTMGSIGECHILGNENLSYKEAFSKIANTIGAKVPSMALPPFAANLYGRFSSFKAKLTGKAPVVTYPLALISSHEHYYSSEKARRELALPQTPVEVGIKESFEWLKENGYLSTR